MARIIVTAEVEDGTQWEEGFRTHLELFRDMTVTATHFAVTDDNQVALYEEVADLDKYMEVMESPAVAEAMAYDGVKRETVKVFVLDRDLPL